MTKLTILKDTAYHMTMIYCRKKIMKKNREINFIRPDSKRKIVIDSIPENVSGYKITMKDHGTIILEAYQEVPLVELSENSASHEIDIQQKT
jgi:hypothetical protein